VLNRTSERQRGRRCVVTCAVVNHRAGRWLPSSIILSVQRVPELPHSPACASRHREDDLATHVPAVLSRWTPRAVPRRRGRRRRRRRPARARTPIKPSPCSTGSAPSSRRKSWLWALAVPMTRAPRLRAIWTASDPTPPAAAWISTVSPAVTCSDRVRV
jgi:hypothetical protein